ncbi:MAG: citramalate synthase [bacterium]
MTVDVYDTLLRDGSQTENIAFSLSDKIRLTHEMDELGIDYVEGGWPGSNPKDIRYFDKMKDETLERTTLTAFGSTRHPNNAPEDDDNLQALLGAETSAITIFGKSWPLHVEDALGVSQQENVEMISSSIRYLKDHGREVIYDAEHYFDGFKHDSDYALKTIDAALEAGADCVVLCDTNGGCLPSDIERIFGKTAEQFAGDLGIHVHNDSGCAVANTIEAVEQGAVQVQGTLNGFGERCGNADLTSVMPNLELKMDIETIGADNLRKLKDVSRFVDELANLKPDTHQPFVGDSAFAHKGGIHVSAVRENPRTYEHIDPDLVGNSRKVLVSELSGKSNILQKAEELGLDISEDDDEASKVVEEVKKLENKGFQYEAAEGSFEILVNRLTGQHKTYFKLVGFRIIIEQESSENQRCEATIKVNVGDRTEHTAADGVGPVNALDNALRKALNEFYPELSEVNLSDFKVRVLDETAGTEAKVRVLVEMTDGETSWRTVGVSENIIEASWQALTDGIGYKLMKTRD